MKIEIDSHSGFCFGVIHAIEIAENYLKTHSHLYCLGDIVHNNEEVARMNRLGLEIITHQQYAQLHDVTVLIRAHGEPPETYEFAKKQNILLIDATCPVVLTLQKNIRNSEHQNENKQILIFGKQGHAEVVGLLGQTESKGVVISSITDIYKIDFTKPSILYSQTTQSLEDYDQLIRTIQAQYAAAGNEALFTHYDTICRSVANRSQYIREFAARFDMVIFVSGEKSSNGLYLFELCKQINKNTHFISHSEQLKNISFENINTVGICGATSTPLWLMEEMERAILK
jgi:4-hydroxy-3-methylbut-2-enyl diphosphate reductase